jgi:hypothetical protein
MSTDADLPLPPLGLSPAEADARFAALQAKLVPLWQTIKTMTQDPQTIVVVPSLTLDGAPHGAIMQAYEERFLFLLLLLRQPRAEMVYVTSQRIDPSVIDYYLGLLPGVIASHARRRLHLVAPQDGSARPLTVKLLERPRLLREIRGLVRDPERAHLVPYNTTTLERDLALRLGIPMYGADPRFFPLGTKTGCRRLFAEEGVPHPLGRDGLRSAEDLVAALSAMRAEKPGLRAAIVKHNEGVAGEGNATIDLGDLGDLGDLDPGSPGEAEAIRARVRAMRCESATETYEGYVATLVERGGIVEERIAGREFRSPSVQLRVTPLGELELLSTHDQLLGGPSGQAYLGCRFPADPGYAPVITREAAKIGRRLAKEGVIGRFALDFVVVRGEDGRWDPYAIELNLRKGGTTHPFLTLQFLTDGRYDPETATFTAPSGRAKCFVATDHLAAPRYRAFTADDLLDVVVRRGLHFHPGRQTGIVLHMLSALGECGRFGFTAVGDSAAEAEALYARAVAAVDEEAEAALAVRPPPGA